MDSYKGYSAGGIIAVNPAVTPLKWKLDAKPEMPTKGTMAKNVVGSFAKNLKSLAGGNPLNADPKVIKERQAMCKACEFMQNKRCTKCGCWLQYKTILRAESCPADRWN